MNSFVINGTEFGVDNVEMTVENDILNLSFTGNDDIIDEIMQDDDSEWSWAIDAPKVYYPYNTVRLYEHVERSYHKFISVH